MGDMGGGWSVGDMRMGVGVMVEKWGNQGGTWGKHGGQEVAKIYEQFNKSIFFFSKVHG